MIQTNVFLIKKTTLNMTKPKDLKRSHYVVVENVFFSFFLVTFQMGKVFFVALTVCASFFRGLDIFCYVSVNVAGSPARGLCLNIDKRPCQMPTDHRLQTSSCLYNHTSAYPWSSPKIK